MLNKDFNFFNDWDCSILKKTSRFSKNLLLPAVPLKEGKVDKEKIIKLLSSEEYGFIHDDGVSYSVEESPVNENVFAGKGLNITFTFSFKKGDLDSKFKVEYFEPYERKDIPVIVHLNFFDTIPNRYLPMEELLDNGVAIAHIYYQEITSDDDDFTNGLAPLLTDRNDEYSAGKIAIWAYASNKVGEYLLEKGYAKKGKLFIAGHSRLGKTSLWASANSDVFSGVLSNCSGCAGTAIFREKYGENIKKITEMFPFWFSRSFLKYADREKELPFDQHFLLSCLVGKKVCIVTAEKDTWADTDAQHLCTQLASNVFKYLGYKGLKKAKLLNYGENDEGGNICFSKRKGTHFLSRTDWQFFIRNIK